MTFYRAVAGSRWPTRRRTSATVRLLICSDLHFEFHRDGGQAFVDCLPPKDAVDVCILAGDIAVGNGIEGALKLFCRRYHRVIFLHGNHEYYGSTRKQTIAHTLRAVRKFDNLTWMHDHIDYANAGPVTIDGQRFIGNTLWFPDTPDARSNWEGLNDFYQIRDFRAWVYEENAATQKLLNACVRSDDVVITHHMPSNFSVAPQYEGSPMNAYFVCPMDDLIKRARPKLWIHGHGHTSCDYLHSDTRIICNPFGYARSEENPYFDFEKIVDLLP